MIYKDYLNSNHWKQLSQKKKRGKSCAICGSTDSLDVHHLVYKENLEDINTKDLRVLCRKCHSFTHYLFNK